GLGRRPCPPRPRSRWADGRHRCGHDRGHPARALRRAPPDRRADVQGPPDRRCRGRSGDRAAHADPGRRPDLRVDRRTGRARPATAPPGRPRRDRRHGRLRRVTDLDLQRPAPRAAGPDRDGRGDQALRQGPALNRPDILRPMRRVLALLFVLLLVLGLGLASAANAASPSPSLAEPSPAGTPVATPPPPGPPFPEPVDNQAVYDFANILTPATEQFSEQMIDAIEAQTKAEVVVYTQAMGRDDIASDDADADAKALMDEWGIGRAGINDGLVILFELDTSLEHGQVRLFGGEGFVEHYLTVDELQAIYQSDMLPLLREAHFDDAVRIALARVVNGTLNAANPAPGGDPSGPAGMPPGPPFPEPETDRAVYDFAGILSPDAI